MGTSSEDQGKQWSGARHMRNEHMVTPTGDYNNHFGGVYSEKTGVIVDPMFRDIGHVFGFFMKESLVAATDLVYPEDEEGRRALDTVGQFMAKIWNESLKDNLNGLCQFKDLYCRLAEIKGGTEAYSTFCHFFVQTYFCYLFTVQKMAIGLQEDFGKDVQKYIGTLQILASLDDDLRSQVITQLSSRGMWPTTIDYAPLLERLEDFLSVCVEGQQMREDHEKKLRGEPTAEGTGAGDYCPADTGDPAAPGTGPDQGDDNRNNAGATGTEGVS